MRRRRGRGLARVLAVLLVVVGAAWASPDEDRAHPRIFFQAKDLESGPDLRGRVAITGSHAEEYALLSQWAEAQLPRKASEFVADSDLCQESALTYALLYQLSGDGRYGDRAVALIQALTTSKEGRLPGFDWPHLPATVATVFDWTYDRLSPENRARLLYDILKRCIYIRDRKVPAEPQPEPPAPPAGARLQAGAETGPLDPAPYLKPLAFASLTLAGEPEAAHYVSDWQEFSSTVLARQLATLEEVGSQGAWLPRTGGLTRELDVLEVLEAWRTAAGALPPPLTAELPGHFRNLTRRILYRLRPGLILPGLAGDPPEPTGPQPTGGAGSEGYGVPPRLFYLLSRPGRGRPEDDPTGRWLAETVRLAHAPPPGSAAWLRDLRARILWLTKGTPRLSPQEAGLPLAASFADTGEVIVRSSWDFSRPDATWLLFRVSASDAGPFPYWNHLALVRGSDALAVETNIVTAGDTGYEASWFGTALAQNSVFDSAGRAPAGVGFVLEACTVETGFAYMRGRVGSSLAERPGGARSARADVSRPAVARSADFEFVREVVAFSDGLAVVRDRVRGLSRPSAGSGAEPVEAHPVWVLHMLEEPRVTGATHTLAGTREGGIRESTESRGVLWQTGQSRGYLAVLLPRTRRLSTIGGKSYEFWSSPGRTAGQNLWPAAVQTDGTALPYSLDVLRRAEVGTWRVEIEPGEGAAGEQGARGSATQFLTVVAAGGLDQGELQASAEERADGVQATVTWQGRLYRVTLEGEGTRSVEVTEAASGKVLIEGRYPGGRGESQ